MRTLRTLFCALGAALVCLLPAFADELPYEPPTRSGSILPWLVAGVLLLCAAAALWKFLRKKKK